MDPTSAHKLRKYNVIVPWFLVAAFLLALGGHMAYSLHLEHRRIDQQERDRLATQARVIDENLSHQMKGANRALEGILVELPRWQGAKGAGLANDHLVALADAMSGVSTILVLDAEGTIISSNRSPLIGQNFRQRDYFQAPFTHPDPSLLYISPPFKTVLGNFVINVTRMVPGPGGRFAGVVTAALDPDYFRILLDSVRYAPDMWTTLTHGDGKQFLSAPLRETGETGEQSRSGSFISRHRESGARESIYTGSDPGTPKNQIVALRTINPGGLRMDNRLVVAVGRDLPAMYASWRRGLFATGFLFAAIAVSLIAGMYLYQKRSSTFRLLAMRYEEEQRENARRLKMAAEAAGVGVWDYDLESGRLEWDDSMFAIFGKPRAEFSASYKDWSESLLPEDLAAAEAAVHAAVNHGRPFNTSFRIRRGDGEVRTIRGMANVQCNRDGKPVRMVGVNEDITERIRSEHALRDNERFLKTLTDVIPGMVGYWTHELCCGFANNEYRVWFGKSPEEILGMRIQDLMGAELFRRIEPCIHRTMGGERQQLELTLTKPDGQVGYTWVHFIPDIYGDRTLGFYMLVSDVTELKQTQFQLEQLNKVLQQRSEEAEAANTAKSRFLANMSHEIRTPMNAVQGLLHLLQRSGLSPLQLDYVEKIQGASQSLLVILNDILDFSKVEAGRLELEQAPFRLDDVMRNLSVMLTAAVLNKDVQVLFDIDADLPCSVKGDALRLQQVLLNLAGNAVKFTDRGTVRVEARVVTLSAAQAEIAFSVQDTGIGIAADKRTSIFEGFVQAESSTTRRYGGTGLGLTISQRLVRLMGGELTVESELGTGSTFRFTAVFGRDAGDRAYHATFGHSVPSAVLPSAPACSGRLCGLRLLVVEDNRINQQVVREVLELEGARVELASTGREGIERVAREGAPFSAVLMDIQMPDMDGYAATRHIRKILGKKDLPIIAMTANALPSDRENCLAAGMNEHVGKPLEVEQLMEVLKRQCGIRTAEEAPLQAPAGVSPPDPAGFGLCDALNRMGGNRALYARLAREFVNDQAGSMDDLRGRLERGDTAGAAYALHTLKGVAATLGASALSRAAADLEAALRGNGGPAGHAHRLKLLESGLLEACGTLQKMADEIDPQTGQEEAARGRAPVTDRNGLVSGLTGLEELLRAGNMLATDEYREFRLHAGEELREQLLELDRAMNRLDFPAAAETCRIMREGLA